MGPETVAPPRTRMPSVIMPIEADPDVDDVQGLGPEG
jgi:hypothetical protein